jgi:hypothetical protein
MTSDLKNKIFKDALIRYNSTLADFIGKNILVPNIFFEGGWDESISPSFVDLSKECGIRVKVTSKHGCIFENGIDFVPTYPWHINFYLDGEIVSDPRNLLEGRRGWCVIWAGHFLYSSNGDCEKVIYDFWVEDGQNIESTTLYPSDCKFYYGEGLLCAVKPTATSCYDCIDFERKG